MKRIVSLIVTGSFLFSAGCQKATDKNGGAAPLASVPVQISVDPKAPPAGAVKLALVWYDVTGDSGIVAAAVEDGPSVPSLPATAEFDITELPPSKLLFSPTAAGGAHLALGKILAYQDGNANGKLDITPVGANAVDRVLSNEGPEGAAGVTTYEVIYSDADANITDDYLGTVTAVPKGFNVYASQGQTAALVSRLPLVASNSAWGGIWACADSGPHCRCHTGTEFFLEGTGGLLGTGAGFAQFTVNDCHGPRTDAEVFVNNGTSLPLNDDGAYRAQDGNSGFQVGSNTVLADLGNTEISVPLELIPLNVTSPTTGQTVPSGQPLAVTWSDTQPIGQLDGYSVCFGGSSCDEVSTMSDVVSQVAAGQMIINVYAGEATQYLPSGSSIRPSNGDQVTVTAAP